MPKDDIVNPTETTTPESDAPASAIQQERDELHDRVLRLTAEFDNYRKRTDRERRELSEAAAADLILEILPVLDDFERALGAPIASGEPEGFRKGIELIHRRLLEALRKRGVEPLDVVGQPFDPAWHEAVVTEPAEGRADGEVLAEVRRGYRIGGRLLRPAMVKVAQA